MDNSFEKKYPLLVPNARRVKKEQVFKRKAGAERRDRKYK